MRAALMRTNEALRAFAESADQFTMQIEDVTEEAAEWCHHSDCIAFN